MDAPHETIEIGLDAKSHQITIVVGSDTSSNGLETQDVQSVVVLHDFSSSPRKGQRWIQRDRSVSRSSRRSSDSARQASSSSKSKLSTTAITRRSDLLRPESPMPHRSSLFDGERRGERDQPPPTGNTPNSSRDKNFTRNRSLSRSSYKASYNRTASNASLNSRCSHRSVDTRTSKQSSLDSAFTNSLPLMEEDKSYRYHHKQKGKGFRPSFMRSNKVDVVVMVADI